MPDGKRAVIEYVNGSAGGISTHLLFPEFRITTVARGTPAFHQFAPVRTTLTLSAAEFFDLAQQTRLYADPGRTITYQILATDALLFPNITISGYFVDVP